MTAANITMKLDDIGLPAWIAVMVVGFIIWWPLGLATLAYLIWSGRMGCWKGRGHGRWQEGVERVREGARRWHTGPSSGNSAFDEYKAETIRRLEEEQRAFREFLDRLRMSKDRAEFDQFMHQRQRSESGPEPQPQA
jgi:hypothetical protein